MSRVSGQGVDCGVTDCVLPPGMKVTVPAPQPSSFPRPAPAGTRQTGTGH